MAGYQGGYLPQQGQTSYPTRSYADCQSGGQQPVGGQPAYASNSYPGQAPASGGVPYGGQQHRPGQTSYPTRSYADGQSGGQQPVGGQPAYASNSYPGQAPASGGVPYGDQQHRPGQPSNWAGAGGMDSEVMLWFQAVDSDNSGRISAIELRHALTNANWSVFSEDACRLMIGMFDRDQSKSIDLQEFQLLWKYIQDWRRVYEQVDQDKSGYIEQVELQQALMSMGYRFSPTFVQTAIARFDHTRQNRITLDSFIVCCVLLHQLTECFKQKDTGQKGEMRVNYSDFMELALGGIP